MQLVKHTKDRPGEHGAAPGLRHPNVPEMFDQGVNFLILRQSCGLFGHDKFAHSTSGHLRPLAWPTRQSWRQLSVDPQQLDSSPEIRINKERGWT